jgi:hypothetical protein
MIDGIIGMLVIKQLSWNCHKRRQGGENMSKMVRIRVEGWEMTFKKLIRK